MVYKGMDLRHWDQRTVEIAKRHDDLEGRFDYWMRSFDGDIKLVEVVYLTHIGLQVLSHANHSGQSDVQQGIRDYREAKGIFELLIEFDKLSNMTPYRQGIIRQYIELCDLQISLSNKSDKSI